MTIYSVIMLNIQACATYEHYLYYYNYTMFQLDVLTVTYMSPVLRFSYCISE